MHILNITNKAFGLLGCYAGYVGSCLQMFQDSLSVLSSKVNIGQIGHPHCWQTTTNLRFVTSETS